MVGKENNADGIDNDYTRLYRETIPSVVSIYVTSRRGRGSQGSGFVYDSEGNIVTNQHVVGDLMSVDVRFSEGDWGTGRVVGSDVYTDLSVVRVDRLPDYADPLPVAGENPTPGRSVAALGNPLGLDGSITAGIVSGTNRSMSTRSGFAIPDVVQTDAPINPGNSGGPLITPEGEVVGVNRAKQGDNIGFAISAEIVNRVIPSLIKDGEHRHPYLKVKTVDVSPTVAEANGLEDTRGILIVDVGSGPSSGVLRGCRWVKNVNGNEVPVGGDVITAIDGNEIRSHEELTRYLITETAPGETIDVSIIRENNEIEVQLTLGSRPYPRRIMLN